MDGYEPNKGAQGEQTDFDKWLLSELNTPVQQEDAY